MRRRRLEEVGGETDGGAGAGRGQLEGLRELDDEGEPEDGVADELAEEEGGACGGGGNGKTREEVTICV